MKEIRIEEDIGDIELTIVHGKDEKLFCENFFGVVRILITKKE